MIRLDEEWKFPADQVNGDVIAEVGRKAFHSSGISAVTGHNKFFQGYICVLEKSPGHLTTYFYRHYPKARKFHGIFPTNLF